jgi:DNA-binding MarR family transcriptional regulator
MIIEARIIFAVKTITTGGSLPDMAEPGVLSLVLYLSKAIHRASSDELLGMRLRQLLVLGFLDRRAPARQQDLCETLMLDANNCVLLLNECERAGWTERRRDTDDRRRHVVDLTDAGREALARAQKAQDTLEDEILAGLDADEREQLRALLRKTIAALHEPAPAAS